MSEILLHPEAEAEYKAAWHWYQARSEDAATRFEAEVESALNSILASPARFTRFDAIHRFAVLQGFPYSIVFRIHTDHVYVVAIAHAKRRPDYWMGRI